jgi:hypothetical protein
MLGNTHSGIYMVQTKVVLLQTCATDYILDYLADSNDQELISFTTRAESGIPTAGLTHL